MTLIFSREPATQPTKQNRITSPGTPPNARQRQARYLERRERLRLHRPLFLRRAGRRPVDVPSSVDVQSDSSVRTPAGLAGLPRAHCRRPDHGNRSGGAAPTNASSPQTASAIPPVTYSCYEHRLGTLDDANFLQGAFSDTDPHSDHCSLKATGTDGKTHGIDRSFVS